jgi:PAS domain S-box-containing protein
MKDRIRNKLFKVAFRTTLVYAFAGTAWILLSDQVLRTLVRDETVRHELEVYKGWTFVGVTAVLLYLTLRRQLTRWEREAEGRRKAEGTVRKSKEHLQQAAQVGGVGTLEINHVTNELYLSPLLREIYGFKSDEMPGVPDLLQRVILEDRAMLEESIKPTQNSAGNGRFTHEHRILLPNGSIRWMRSTAQTSFEGEGPGRTAVRTIGAFVDITERKLAEEAIRERENQYRAVIETSADGFWMLDMEGRILEVNDAYVRRSGYSREELLSMRVADFEVLEKPEEIRNRIEAIARDGVDLFETMHRAKDGTIWRAEVDVSHWPIAGGRLFAFIRDVNQRKRSEALLRTRVELSRLAEQNSLEALLRSALDKMEIFTGSRLGCIHFVDPAQISLGLQAISTATPKAGRRRTGDGPVLIKESRRFNECFISKMPVLENQCTESLLRVGGLELETKLARCLTVPVIRQDKVTAIVSVANKSSDYTTEDASAVQEISGAIMDLVERKLAEEAVHRSEGRYRALVETSFDWIWELDSESRYTFTSPKVLDLLGYQADEILGKTPFDFMRVEEAIRVRKLFDDAAAQRIPFAALEKEYLHKDGRRIILESSGVPIFGPGREFKGYRGNDRNITERKLAEKERQVLEAQLRQAQKMEAIGTLAGGVAHDFNNILTVIHGNASLLLSPQMKEPDKSECAQQIVRAAERAAGLTRQLLMFSRKQVMQLSNVNLNEIVGNMTKMLQRILGEDVALQTNYAPNIGFIRGDVGMIEQILLNLAVNSRDAMPEGGHLTVATGTEMFSDKEAQQHPDAVPGLHVWLSVTDTGAGIAPEILPHIFEPFFTTKEIGKGTGLGLATVYGIVKQHRGWMTVDTGPNKGTSFRIHFPALPGMSTAKRIALPRTDLPKGTETILVVEDDPAVRDLIVSLLERCGYRALQAQSGRAALGIWKERHEEVDLLLTDVVMPDGITGLQLADTLKQDRPALKVIYVTGYSTELAGKGTSLIEGVNFLQKPFSPESLARALRILLNNNPAECVAR